MNGHGARDGGGGPLGDLLTLDEAAARYGVKHDRLRRAAWDGRLEARRLGRARVWLVRPADVERYLETTRRGPRPGTRRAETAKE